MLSAKRKEVLDFIAHYIRENDYAPSLREIGKSCGIKSPSMVQHHLNILEHDGYIRREPQIPRAISLLEAKPASINVPVLGVIAAGEPIPVPSADAWTNTPDEYVQVPSQLVRGLNKVFALKVKGTSMVDALIDDGDIVLLQLTNAARNGDMVAVWLEEQQETTLKRLYRERRRIRLQPANAGLKPMYCNPNNVRIQGKVVGLIRKP